MKVSVDGFDFNTDQVEIVFDDGRKLVIDPEYISAQAADVESLSDAILTPLEVLFDPDNGSDDECVVDLSNNGSMEFDKSDGTIRYFDSDGNCQDKWEPGDESYDQYKSDYFPELEVDEDSQ
jgi:virulence-associated protein VagC